MNEIGVTLTVNEIKHSIYLLVPVQVRELFKKLKKSALNVEIEMDYREKKIKIFSKKGK